MKDEKFLNEQEPKGVYCGQGCIGDPGPTDEDLRNILEPHRGGPQGPTGSAGTRRTARRTRTRNT